MMARSLIFPILLFLSGCRSAPSLPKDDYYGRLQINGYTYRLHLDLSKPALLSIGFRGQEIPLDTVYTVADTLHFGRADFYSEFKGYIDHRAGTITGRWVAEDSISYPLTFVPVLADTIVGLHPRTSKEYSYQPPTHQKDDLKVCTVMDQDMRQEPLNNLIREIMDEKYKFVHSMLVARNNCLVVEEYFYGFKRDAHFGIQSATKSFVSALTGIALAKGEIKSVQASLCEYLPRYQDLTCNTKNKSITLDQLLSMSTGLAWDEITYDYGHEKNTSMIAAHQPDQFRYLLTRPRSKEKVFAYNSLNHLMMNQVLQSVTRMENDTEMEERLLQPLGITSYDLGEPDNGVIGDIFLRPRDMLKFGLLYLNHGVWNGKQVVPMVWVKESTKTKIEIEPGFGYAYFWWTKQFSLKEKTVDSYFAWGYGGQYIFVVPELELVVVFNGSNWSTDPKLYYFEMMEKYILPSTFN